MPTPVTKTMSLDNDADVLANLQSLGTSVAITGYTSSGGKQVTFADTPNVDDISWVEWFFQVGLDQVLV